MKAENSKVTNFLFHLIKSLTQHEKRHFKLDSNFYASEGKRYIQMFDAIDKMDVYDENILLKIFEGNKQKLSVAKNFLYNKILRNLRGYNEHSSIHTQLSNLIEDARILINKGLMYPALKRLNMAKKMAIVYDEQWFLLKIADYELEINKTISHVNVLDSVDEITAGSRSALTKYNEIFELKHLYHDLRAKYIVRKDLNIEDEKKKISDSDSSFHSFHAKSYYHLSQFLISLIERNKESQKNHSKKLADIWLDNPKIARSHSPDFMLYLANYANSCIETGHFDDFKYTIGIMRTVPCKTNYEKALMFRMFHFLS